MMRILYSIGIFIFQLMLKVHSWFDPKSQSLIQGQKITKRLIQQKEILPCDLWIHCASMGEYMEVQWLIHQLLSLNMDLKITLSFFSPSGYQNIHNPNIQQKIYLPEDQTAIMSKLISQLNPQLMLIVRSELWYNMLQALWLQKIPTILVSANMSSKNLAFTWPSSWFKKHLLNIDHIYTASRKSYEKLRNLGFQHVSVGGNLRLQSIIHEPQNNLETIAQFKEKKKLFIFASIGESDLVLLSYIPALRDLGYRVLIAPHELDKTFIGKIEEKCLGKICRYTEWFSKIENDQDILLLNTIGDLRQAYAYADLAYVGGGFAKGIHNIMEGILADCRICIGPNYEKFEEAIWFARHGSLPIAQSPKDFLNCIQQMEESAFGYKFEKNKEQYIQENAEFAAEVLNHINQTLDSGKRKI